MPTGASNIIPGVSHWKRSVLKRSLKLRHLRGNLLKTGRFLLIETGIFIDFLFQFVSLSGMVETPRLQAKRIFAKSRRDEHLEFFDKAAAKESN